jgi:polyisoprenoid-binding protein YceI
MGKVASLVCAAAIFFGQGGWAAATDQAGLHSIDVKRSWIKVYVFKEGVFAFASDNHEVDVPIASGSFDQKTNSVQLTVDAAKMRVLDPPSRRDKVQANMLGPQVLDVAKYPTISYRSTALEDVGSVKGSGAKRWVVNGDLTLHGQTHPIPLSVERFDATHFTGSAVIKQSAFGITPLRVAGGTVRVKDDVHLIFDVRLE